MKGLAPAMAKGGHAARRNADHESRSSTPENAVLALQRHAGNHAVGRLIAARGSARPLPPLFRREMEARLGTDLQSVRIHDDAEANRQAASLGAQAVTVGDDIVFGEGRFVPDTMAGRQLIGHELAHVVQQRRGGAMTPRIDGRGPLEAEAGRVAGALATGGGPVSVSGASAVGPAAAPAPLSAYPDDMLAKEQAELAQRLAQKGEYSGREGDRDQMMAVKREIERRAREQAVAEALAAGTSSETESDDDSEKKKPAPVHEPPGNYNYHAAGFEGSYVIPEIEDFDARRRAEEQAEIARLQKQEEDRPKRLIMLRRYLTLHGVSKWDIAEVMGHFLTHNDMMVLKKNGLDPPSFWSHNYADKVVDTIDQVVPPDQQTAALYEEDMNDVRRRAGEIQTVAAKNEALASEGPHALAGRVEGALVAYAVGKDPLWGSEVGAAIAGPLDARMLVSAGSTARNRPFPDANENAIATPMATADVPVAEGGDAVPIGSATRRVYGPKVAANLANLDKGAAPLTVLPGSAIEPVRQPAFTAGDPVPQTQPVVQEQAAEKPVPMALAAGAERFQPTAIDPNAPQAMAGRRGAGAGSSRTAPVRTEATTTATTRGGARGGATGSGRGVAPPGPRAPAGAGELSDLATAANKAMNALETLQSKSKGAIPPAALTAAERAIGDYYRAVQAGGPQASAHQPKLATAVNRYQAVVGEGYAPEAPITAPPAVPPKKREPPLGESMIKPSERSGAKVDVAVQKHGEARDFREQSGTAVQSAHQIPTSAARDLFEYSRSRALTVLMPRDVHAALRQCLEGLGSRTGCQGTHHGNGAGVLAGARSGRGGGAATQGSHRRHDELALPGRSLSVAWPRSG